jgi:hypothetical protein
LGSKTTIYLSLGLHKEEAFSSQKRPSNTSKHELFKKFLLLWVIFALLDPDPDSEGSGSTDPIESGYGFGPATLQLGIISLKIGEKISTFFLLFLLKIRYWIPPSTPPGSRMPIRIRINNPD